MGDTGLNPRIREDYECGVRDLLADLRHLCAEDGFDFEAFVEGSASVFNEEVQEEAEEAAEISGTGRWAVSHVNPKQEITHDR
jgi:hypothetical protein